MSSAMEPYVGVDVSKARLDVALLPTGESFVVANDEEGLEELLGRLKGLRPTLVVLGASGGFQRPVAAALAAAGVAVAVLNPRQTREFARATGQLAKNDALDARALARSAEAVQPTPREALYMGALIASRYNPTIREFYQRFLAADKPKKVALVACMRKLLVILNVMMRDRTPWRFSHELNP